MIFQSQFGRLGPRSAVVLVVVLCLVGLSATQMNSAQSPTGAAPWIRPTNTSRGKNGNGPSKKSDIPTHSTTIALTSDETRVIVVNREANTVSIIQVKNANGNDVAVKLAEIGVGQEPRCVAVHPNDRVAYVTNGISGTVSVVDLVQRREVQQIQVGTEPRGCALTPDGSLLYVASHTEGTVSILVTGGNPLNPMVDGTIQIGGNPTAIAITNEGPLNIPTVFVTQLFAELNPDFKDPVFDGNGEARDLGKQGVVFAFPAGNSSPPITKIVLKPLADSGFTANRVMLNNFCNMMATGQSLIFCPDPINLNNPLNMNDPQGVFPNQLLSAVIRDDRLYLPNIGAQPEPPEIFNANVQALVYNVDVDTLEDRPTEHVNLNKQIAVEPALPPPSLSRTFGNDLVAIDGDAAGEKFLIVSRGGNEVFRAKVDPMTKQLDILNAAKTAVDCRLQTGNLPSGVAMRRDGTRGYANNEANFSVTSMNIEDGLCLTLQLDIPSSTPPPPGSFAHAVLVGKLAFFTALGIPDNNLAGFALRNIFPRNFKGKMSK